MHAIEVGIGRLLTMRMAAPMAVEEARDVVREVKLAFAGHGGRLVVILDLRELKILAPEVTELFLNLMKRDNPLIERSAYLVLSENNMVGMQFERMLREANNPSRKLLKSTAEAEEFLNPVLSAEEKTHLHEFLMSGKE